MSGYDFLLGVFVLALAVEFSTDWRVESNGKTIRLARRVLQRSAD